MIQRDELAHAAAGDGRWARVTVDVGAIEHNVATIAKRVGAAQVWAVVKANGYGHGAVPVARAAVAAGASGLCVALVQEAVELRQHGIDAPILVLSEQPVDQLHAALAHHVQLTVYRPETIAAVSSLAAQLGLVEVPVHLKVDTGMHRVGCAPAEAVALARVITESPALTLASVFTHLAIADVPADPYTDAQLARFDTVLDQLAEAGLRPPVVHAANSAGGLAHPSARRDLVRLGIAMYGLLPGHDVADLCGDLRPALTLTARVSHVKRVAGGERISYGLRHRFDRDTTVATLPLGYADGVPRRLAAAGGEVLLGGRRRRIVGVVTMDQLMIDCGDDRPDVDVCVGDEAVLIGRQGDQVVTADDWADLLGTISYEITCGLSARLPRVYV